MDKAHDASNTPKGISNTFVNDGSFFEKFKQMQELQKQTEAAAQESKQDSTKTGNFSSVPLISASGSRVTKSGALVVKLSGVKKPAGKAKRLKDVSVKKAFKGSSSESEGEEESPSWHDSSAASSGGRPGDGTVIGSTASGTMSSMKVSPSQPSPAAASVSSGVGQKRKRASRWGMQPQASSSSAPTPPSKTGSEDMAISAAIASFSGAPRVQSQSQQQDLTEAQKQQLREQIEMNKLVAEIRGAQQRYSSKPASGKKNKYEYDSDEETEGGTWEHKKRKQEMYDTESKALDLTEKGKGKHHIGDFLPPEELDKFVEKVQAIKEDRDPDFSDYKAHKLTEENVGFKMLQKAGWKEGAGLGTNEDGITAPINKGKRSFDQAGVGAEAPGEVKKEDDMFDVYRKRMMLAYRFRPNPLNNPRRPYY